MSPESSRPAVILMADEADLLVAPTNNPAGPVLGDIVLTGRKDLTNAFISTHTFGQVAQEIRANCTMWILFALPDRRCRWAASGRVKLTPERDELLAALPQKRFLLMVPECDGEPVLVEAMEEEERERPSPEWLEGHKARTLEEMGHEVRDRMPPRKERPEKVYPVSFAAMRVLERIAGQPETRLERAAALDISESDEGAARKELKDKDLIAEHATRLGKGANFFTVTKAGAELCGEAGFKVVRHKGGPTHAYMLKNITGKIPACVKGARVVGYEKEISGVWVDALLRVPGGDLFEASGTVPLAVQASDSCNTRHEAGNLRKLFGSDELASGWILFVATEKKKVKAVTKTLKDMKVAVPPNAILVDFKTFMGTNTGELLS